MLWRRHRSSRSTQIRPKELSREVESHRKEKKVHFPDNEANKEASNEIGTMSSILQSTTPEKGSIMEIMRDSLSNLNDRVNKVNKQIDKVE